MVTAAMKLKKSFLLGRKVMANQDSILKSRDITSRTKVCLVKAMVFPVVMNACESWTIRKTEHCGAGEDASGPLVIKRIKPVNPKENQS